MLEYPELFQTLHFYKFALPIMIIEINGCESNIEKLCLINSNKCSKIFIYFQDKRNSDNAIQIKKIMILTAHDKRTIIRLF